MVLDLPVGDMSEKRQVKEDNRQCEETAVCARAECCVLKVSQVKDDIPLTLASSLLLLSSFLCPLPSLPAFLPVPPGRRLRVLTELVSKMRDMQMDKTELGCLRAIILFNPGALSPPHASDV